MKEPWISPALQPFVDQLTDPQVFIVTLYGEARSEPVEGIIAVASCVRNRVQDGRWGKSYRAVCLAPWQFSCWSPKGGTRNFDRVSTLVRTMAEKKAVTDPVIRELAYFAHGFIHDLIRDTVKGSTHYHTATLQPRPKWAQDVVPAVQRASHVFYAGVA